MGWEAGAPVQAYALLVEDSGDGQAWWSTADSEGVRLRRAGSGGAWSLGDASQWGEAYLYYGLDYFEAGIAPYLEE